MEAQNLPYDASAMDTMTHPLSPLIGLQLNPGNLPYDISTKLLGDQMSSIRSSNLPYDSPEVHALSNMSSSSFASGSASHDFQNVLHQYPMSTQASSLPYDEYNTQNSLNPIFETATDVNMFQSANLPYDGSSFNPNYYEYLNPDSAVLSSSPKPVKMTSSNPYGPAFESSFEQSSTDALWFQSSNLPYDMANAPGSFLDCNVSFPMPGYEVPLSMDGAVNKVLLSGIEAEQRQGEGAAAAAGSGRIGHGADTVVPRHGSTNTVPIHPSPAPRHAAAMATTSADVVVVQQPSSDEMDLQQLFATLNEYLSLEVKFQPRLCLPTDAEQGEVSTGARDGAAHIMRCLKVWFDLPADVLFHAINLLDRFLTKMKVRPCHVPCITVSCMNIAIERHYAGAEQSRTLTVDELVTISQSACTPRDVVRMSKVIEDKLSLAGAEQPITVLQWLRLFYRIALSHTHLHCKEEELVNLIEIALCDYKCANTRSSELALVLLYHKLEGQLISMSLAANGGGGEACALPDEAYRVYELFAHLQHVCHMSDTSLMSTRTLLSRVLVRYERGSGRVRQRLVWRLSERTLKVLRPTDRLTSLLPTIQEQQLNTVEASPPRNRSGSESSLNEETCDWPRSPVLPVYCES